MMPRHPLVLALCAASLPRVGIAETTGERSQSEKLAWEVRNPVANLVSVPFQNNFNFGVGPEEVTRYVLNVRPVIPVSLSEKGNLVTRTLVPISNQPSPAPGILPAAGLGDINPTIFLSPAQSGPVIWGVGLTFTLPAATDAMLGSGMWSAGPAAVVLTMRGHWVVGTLANQQWSFAASGDDDVSALLIQPFVNYNLPNGCYLTSAPTLTVDWRASGDDAWTDPVEGRRRKGLPRRPVAAERADFHVSHHQDPGLGARLATTGPTPVFVSEIAGTRRSI